MNKKLKIAIYSGSIPSSTFIENLIKGMAIQHIVLLFGKQKSKPNYTEKTIYCYPTYANKIYNLIVTKWRLFLLLLRYPKRVKVLWQQLKPINGFSAKYNWCTRYVPVLLHLPDIFHIQWAKDVEKWLFLKEEFDVKMVLSLRGSHINYSPIANPDLATNYHNFFPKIDAFHAVSNVIGTKAQIYGADATKITTIHSLLPKSMFSLFRQPKERKNQPLKIISVGRHHWVKGYSTALDACKLLKERQIPFQYTIVAGGVIPEELIFKRHQLDLKEEVLFMDELPQNKVFEMMQQSDALLLPSLEEGIANVVLEAMAIGTSVISTDCGGMNEIVISNKNGWTVPILNTEAFALALIDFKNTPFQMRTKIILSAHEFIKSEFDINEVTKDFNNLYRDLYL